MENNMLDIGKILSRAWHILWNYRTLWIFGFILALAGGGGSLRSTSNYSMDGGQRDRSTREWTPEGWEGETWEELDGDTVGEKMADVFGQLRAVFENLREQYPEEFRLGIAVAITLVVMALIFSAVLAVLRYVSETAAIRMVDDYEGTGVKVGFRQGWKLGWTRAAWKVFLVDLLVHLPVLLLFVVFGLVGWWIISAILSGVEWNIISSIVAGAGLVVFSIFVTVIAMAVLYVLRDFAWRMIVLDGEGGRAALRSAAGLVRRQWKNVGLMWLVMVGISIAWGIVFFLLFFPLLVVSIITAVGGLLAAILPALLTVGIASLLSAPAFWPWIFAAVVGLPIFLVVTFSPIILVGGWGAVFQSSAWTLTYRELKVIETITPEEERETAE
jgi:hypothetical protein